MTARRRIAAEEAECQGARHLRLEGSMDHQPEPFLAMTCQQGFERRFHVSPPPITEHRRQEIDENVVADAIGNAENDRGTDHGCRSAEVEQARTAEDGIPTTQTAQVDGSGSWSGIDSSHIFHDLFDICAKRDDSQASTVGGDD